MESIGVTSIEPWFVLDDETLIKDLYYFDKLVYRIGNRKTLETFCNTLPNGQTKFKEKMDEIEKLELAGLIYEYKYNYVDVEGLKYADEQLIKYKLAALDLSSKFTTKDRPFKDVFLDFLERFREVGQLDARANSIMLNKNGQGLYTPILRGNFYNFPDKELCSSTTVLSVLLRKFPIVTNDTELDDIIAFRSDPESQLKLSRLKDWVLEMGKKNYTEKEIEQKIDHLLREYTKQLELHKLKYNLGTIESIVTISLEVLENLVKLNFSKAAKVLFDLTKQELALLEAEQKMTGRELALVHQLNEKKNR